MAVGSDAHRFARATLTVAATMGVVEGFLDRFGLLAQTFRENKAFRHLLITHRVPLDAKMGILRQAFAAVLTDLEFEILHLLLQQGMGGQVSKIARSLLLLAHARGFRQDLTIFTPGELSEEELDMLGERIRKHVKQPLRIVGVTDPRLLGGMKLRLGNTLVDGTVSRRLELLREQLV